MQIAEQMSDFLLTGAVANAINMPSVTAEEAPRLKPYMSLCGLLGAMAGQLTAALPDAAAGALTTASRADRSPRTAGRSPG